MKELHAKIYQSIYGSFEYFKQLYNSDILVEWHCCRHLDGVQKYIYQSHGAALPRVSKIPPISEIELYGTVVWLYELPGIFREFFLFHFCVYVLFQLQSFLFIKSCSCVHNKIFMQKWALHSKRVLANVFAAATFHVRSDKHRCKNITGYSKSQCPKYFA